MTYLDQLLQQGWQVHQSGDVDGAKRRYEQVLDAEPDNANALVYLGIAHFDQRRFGESVEAYRKAIRIRKQFPVAWNNLGNSLRMLGEVEEADECFAEALRMQPGYLSALKNRGTLWVWTGQIERGLGWYQQALEVDPNNAELHRNLGVIHLLLGNFERGWPEYRWRWRMPGMSRPRLAAPIWRGESLQDKTILIYPEQGLGDTIQFVRVATALKRLGAAVIVQCSERMLPLFTSVPNVDRLTLDTAVPPPVHFHASMIEVVDVLYGQTGQMEWCNELFADGDGYLTVSNALIDYWRDWLKAHTQLKRVGIAWQGNPSHHADVYRSVPLEVLRPLSRVGGIDLISLQFGFGCEQLDSCDFADRIVRLPSHVDTDGGAFTDTAAIVRNLDCVVTTDTSIAHLAGTVATPVALMLGCVPDWRWGLEGESTAWYPTMKLIRQEQLGIWDNVIERACQWVTSS
jgi:hypothetical protein